MKEFLYWMLDLLTFRKGMYRTLNGFGIRFPTRYHRYYHEGYERESFEYIRKVVRDGDVVLDIGGHIGLYAAALGRLVQPNGHVYSFEPTPNTNRVLRETVKLNGLGHIVTVKNKAVSKNSGNAVFYVSDHPMDNSNSLVNFTKPRKVHPVDVSLVSIDDFSVEIGKKINFIKIDVEGAELDALMGAKQTLLRDRPKGILALHPVPVQTKGDSLEQIWDAVTECGYNLLFKGVKIDKASFCRQQDLFDVWLEPLAQQS